ncbi:Protein-disulfide isomerase [Raineyella antarctica]|uniref:Protein-disulfide isomerase n=1 Tax=Raineyella antarctica TaxID=1577474 RepID=A0A1G6H435_9ACTN|nr:thioredoxin domain-containing protein [Raineyella antarctica]SDB88186.1 Protein-disulfide isomerase [Raineyella antarctica]
MSTKKPAGSTSASNRRAQMRAEAEAAAQRARQRKILVTAVSVVVVAALIIAGVVWAQSRQQTPAASNAVPPNTTAAGDGIRVNPGVAEGKPVVELFFDYQCPGCGSLERSAGDVILGAAQKGDYQLVYRPMTFLDTNLRNDASERAANAAACYAEVGDYPKYHQLIFNNQPAKEGDGYTDTLLRDQLPAQLGTTGDKLTQFQTCYDQGKYKNFVDHTNTEAAKAGVTGTPTIRVNGKDMDLSGLAKPADFPAAVAKTAAGQ